LGLDDSLVFLDSGPLGSIFRPKLTKVGFEALWNGYGEFA